MDKSDNSIADHERRIKALEAMDLTAATEVNASGEIDTASILKQVNLIKAEVSSMRSDFTNYQARVVSDLEALRHELRGYTDKKTSEVEKALNTRLDKAVGEIKYEADRLRAEFETFKSKDFRDLEARVSALEKRFLRL